MSSPSTTSILSAFSPFANLPGSLHSSQSISGIHNPMMSSIQEDHSYLSAPSPNPSNNGSNETYIDPSPVAPSSSGTEFTDLDEAVEHQKELPSEAKRVVRSHPPTLRQPELSIKTSTPARLVPSRSRSDEDEPPQSVIHAPPGFTEFARSTEPAKTRSSPSPSLRSDTTVRSPAAAQVNGESSKQAIGPASPPALTTTIQPVKDWSERATPRAQTRWEVDSFDKKPLETSLEDIPEGPHDIEAGLGAGEEELGAIQKTIGRFKDTAEEIEALRTALAECWTLCNTLASLSYIHRERIFNFAGKGDLQEYAWKSCWKLCQKLYDSRDDDTNSHVRPTLDLCRDFCQALFEVRVRENEGADSVLRVSFELNNHLYNTHDRNLPEAFRERTLDFYITLCHRLMKQKSRLAEETDSLLRACWSLAEMLFSLRQNKREGKDADEELLGSAVQACWELCDLFREGWTQIRPDRGTPRPSQTTFTQAFQQAQQFGFIPTDGNNGQRGLPETPTTIFEDTVNLSPDEAPTPNILILAAGHQEQQQQPSSHSAAHSQDSSQTRRPPHNKWSSSSSTLSASSRNSSLSNVSSAHTITSPSVNANAIVEDPNFTLLKLLFVKAAQNSGFQRSGPLTLPTFTKSMPSDSFGSLTWQVNLLENYKKAVLADVNGFREIGPPMRAGAVYVARAVAAMVQTGYYGWLRDLYRLVFGFYIEEAGSRKGVAVQT
ncbi:hypothetical protein GJ744_005529 [Endocarpon pusillum]|uniref:DUF7624 domain-containing protein n=1 Tax=Endocarpon pusillum TaxID=364733 RepID=A0A8H7AKT8_9EURO|nr:hypothetical protein GJ744_005529 [Endocarpon pusillum]